MVVRARKGQTSYGEAIGIIMLDTYTPFIPGDVGNASTYSFPVRYETVKGLTVTRIFSKDRGALPAIREAGRKLVGQGVRAVTGDCGFMAIFQEDLAGELGVPVFLSSLLQVPFISRIIGRRKKVGIISANSEALDDSTLLTAVGIDASIPICIKGLQDREHFHKAVIEEIGMLDPDEIEREVVNAAEELVQEDPDVGAILLECSVLPPYGAALQEAVGLPVFDYVTMIDYVYAAVVKKRYVGIM